jgi:hypothetical protein
MMEGMRLYAVVVQHLALPAVFQYRLGLSRCGLVIMPVRPLVVMSKFMLEVPKNASEVLFVWSVVPVGMCHLAPPIVRILALGLYRSLLDAVEILHLGVQA